jgi:cation diffusion facilitator CzcD-associated flavoprotein CzcO
VLSEGCEQRTVEAVIVGGGLSGIAAATMLEREGIRDYVLLEQSDGLGGTWHHNTYPGCACDIPAALYSYSFRPSSEWSRLFPTQPEILRYLRQVADEHDVPRHAELGTEMLEARWDDDQQRWTIETNRGVFLARFLFLATGSLHAANTAEIPGADRFGGRMFHSSHWPAGYDGTGDRVAVIGTGASSIQITPEMSRTADHVTVFQRTPAWIQPKPDWAHSAFTRRLFRRVPMTQRLLRAVIWAMSEVLLVALFRPKVARVAQAVPRLHLRLAVKDRKLRRALTPDYAFGCKRVLVSSDFYPALQRPNTRLVPAAVTRITERSVIDANGEEHAVDTIILATGFHFGAGPIAGRVRGSAGDTLSEVWAGSPSAYLGTTVSGFPNMAIMWGPNSSVGSVFITAEAQTRYLADMLRTLDRRGLRTIDVRPEAQAAFKTFVEERTAGSVVNVGGCHTFYLDENGRNQLLWPGSAVDQWRRLAAFDPDAYRCTPASAAEPALPSGTAAA